jgi:hypothetical protein
LVVLSERPTRVVLRASTVETDADLVVEGLERETGKLDAFDQDSLVE